MNTALIIIDMQTLVQHRIDSGRDHVNPDTPSHIKRLATAFRDAGKPVIHVRHQDDDVASPLHPTAPGFEPMPCAQGHESEPVFLKKSSSAFATTALEEYLRKEDITQLVVTGAVAGFCVNSTVRAGADLGFKMTVVKDAVLGFDLPSANLSAREIYDVTVGLLEADFAAVVDSDTVLASIQVNG